METFEIRYFLAVARTENIHRAAENGHASPGSLSKAISRLEGELGVKLFQRDGRNIRLTDHGRLFQHRASEMIHLEESIKMEVAGHRGNIHAVIAGPEILLAKFGLQMATDIKKIFPRSTYEYHALNEEKAMEEVERGDAHLALITRVPSPQLSSKVIGEANFRTYVGHHHPLYHLAQTKKAARVEEVLQHEFASPGHPLLGTVGPKQSLDGWRDDRFPRKVGYLASSLKLLEELAISGKALVYLPDYFADSLKILPLKISGCPYSCSQKIKLVARRPQESSWLNRFF